MAVPTGRSRRASEGTDPLETGAAPVRFISGVDRYVGKLASLQAAGVAPEELWPRIASDCRTADTRGNAHETASWIDSRQSRSLRPVTARCHMRGSLPEPRRTLPKTQIVAHPVFPSAARDNRRHFSPGGIVIVAGEFGKHVAAANRLTVLSAESRGSVQ